MLHNCQLTSPVGWELLPSPTENTQSTVDAFPDNQTPVQIDARLLLLIEHRTGLKQ